MSIKGKLTSIDYGRKCLEFLEERIDDSGYRGMQVSQHNRYNCDFIVTMLQEMYNLVGDKKMTIRTTDLSKRPNNTPDERIYAEYVAKLCNKLGRCTQDSVRKNLFVDLNRMGFIYRYNKNGELVLPSERSTIKFVKLTRDAIRLIETKSLFDKNFIYTKGIEKMTHGLEFNLVGALQQLDNKLNIYEFMFFGSYLGCKLNVKQYTEDDIVELVKEFRSMSKFQKTKIINEVQLYCNPDNFDKLGMDKTDKRDFSNWKNEAEQIYMLLGQTVLYEVIGDENLVIKVGDGALFDSEAKLKRSYSEKIKYFEHHNVKKTPGYELHHVVSLFSANDKNEYSILDTWQNMIYIDAFMHSKLHDTSNTYFEINFNNDDLELIDIVSSKHNSKLLFRKDKNILYNTANKGIIKTYNEGLLGSVYEQC